VSRDPNLVSQTIDRAIVRARVTVAAESAAVGVAIGAWSPWTGLVAAVLVAGWRARAASRRAVIRALERSTPSAQNLLVTADEIESGALNVAPAVRARVTADAQRAASAVDIAAAWPRRRAWMLVALAAVASTLVAVRDARHRSTLTSTSNADTNAQAVASAQTGVLHVTVTIEPPPYTGLAASTSTDPVQIQAIENSRLSFAVMPPAAHVTVDANGTRQTLSLGSDRAFAFRDVVIKSGFVLFTADDGGRRLIPIAMTVDALPAVKVVAPGRDLVYAGGNPRIAFEASATDDYGLRSLVLRYTKVTGSGEQFEFTNGELPLTLTKTSGREWKGTVTRTLSELALADGDMLVYHAAAADARPGDREASSDAFFIEVSKLGVSAGDAFTVNEEETRYALSQQMLIVKTERLIAKRASLSQADLVEESQGLAVEQRMIRSEFVFMLGGEIEDEEVEAEQSVELQAGRLANRGQSDLRAATVAMSQAEKLLTASDPAEALKAERAAVTALQRAFARDRYILRALATRSQLDLSRRLTGTSSPVPTWRRQLADIPTNRRGVLLQSLLHGLGEALSSKGSSGARAQLSVLAEMAIRIDVQSAALRAIASNLQTLADRWDQAADADRRRQLDDVAVAVSAEAKRALADPPAAVEARP